MLGLAFVNLDTGEAVLSQINDSQTFVRTIHKLAVFNPSTILMVSSSAEPKSKLFSILEDNLDAVDGDVVLLDRKYWAEVAGMEYIQQLVLVEDLDAILTAVKGNYFAVCCFAAVCAGTYLRSILTTVGTEICRAWSLQDIYASLAPHQV